MDGVITIGTSLDRKQLDKDLAKAEKDMEKFAKEGEKLTEKKAKLEIDVSEYYKELDKIKAKDEEIKRSIEKTKKEYEKNSSYSLNQQVGQDFLKNEIEITTSSREKEKAVELDALNSKYSKQLSEINVINAKIKENNALQAEQAIKIDKMKNKTKGLYIDYDKAGNSISKLSKKIVKWGLALLSIRGVMGGVRQAMSTLSQYNDDLATKLNSIRLILASALEPIVNWLIQGVYTVLSYVNALLKAWFGIDLFARATALSMKKSAGSAKDMNKSMAGFDEMNVVQDTSASGGAGGGKGFEAPENVPIPGWLEWIAQNKDKVIDGLLGIAGGLLAVKLGLGGLMGLGIGMIIAGILSLIQDVVEFIKDPTWDGFANILLDISLILAGIAVVMIAINAANPLAWIVLLITAIVAIVAVVIKNWDTVKGILGAIGNWIYQNVITPIINFFYQLMDTIESIFNTVRSIITAIFTTLFHIIVDPFMSAFDSIKEIFSNVVKIIQGVCEVFMKIFKGDIPGAFQSMKNVFKSVCNALGSIFKAPINLIISALNALIKGLNKLSFDIPDWIPLIGGQKWGFNLPEIPKLFTGGILNAPGKGVNYGGANIGERGAEGVIPLTNTAMMEELGRQIGKNVVINASITNSMDGRVISRQLKTIKTDDDFAFNN